MIQWECAQGHSPSGKREEMRLTHDTTAPILNDIECTWIDDGVLMKGRM